RAGSRRYGSPPPGRSIFSTSAPWSANSVPANGAATYCPTSRTCKPCRSWSLCTLRPDLQCPEGDVDVDLDVPRQAEDPLRNDVAHDLVRATTDRRGRRVQEQLAPTRAAVP